MTTHSCYSEIEFVTATWAEGHCDEKCITFVNRKLLRLEDVVEVFTDSAEPVATVFWKPKKNFAYRTIESPLKMIGLEILKVELKIRGTISRSNKRMWLTSIGDSTKVELLNEPEPDESKYVEKYNVYAYKLNDETRKQLIEAQKEFKVVTVTGYLFQPERTPLRLVIEELNIPSRP